MMDKIDFTFGVLCYNQEDFIIEHLESIKYQIENYGSKYNTHLIISDDCSTDKTVAYAEVWIKNNYELFTSVRIMVQEHNQGIVKNVTKILRNIDTEKFKILAGDDIYYKNNIFISNADNDITISKTIAFRDCAIESTKDDYNFLQLLLSENPQALVKKYMEYSNCLEAPGVFFSNHLLDNGLYRSIEKYTWIEDVPMWKYLFAKKGIDVRVSNRIYVLYRDSVGISTDINHSKRKGFLEDLDRIKLEIFTKDKFPYKNLHRLEVSLRKKCINKKDNRVKEFYDELSRVNDEGNVYLKIISTSASEFKKNNLLL